MAGMKKTGPEVLRLRRRLGLNQHEFWSPLGVTQSGGSRYESDRRIPKPVLKLIELAYGNKPQEALKQLRARR
jgi:DNA-binding transcriptional regulator YiaG